VSVASTVSAREQVMTESRYNVTEAVNLLEGK